jgi:hypothetical protein
MENLGESGKNTKAGRHILRETGKGFTWKGKKIKLDGIWD